MKHIYLLVAILFVAQPVFAQHFSKPTQLNRKGQFFVFWGWNKEAFTRSDIHFTGADYDFTLQNVVAKDRQSHFTVDTYFRPSSITIPQYNVRIGYFINPNTSISIGTDHMKYVVQQNQLVRISGRIANSGTPYDKVYADEEILIQKGFLEFEHTDGLNYFNADVRRHHDILTLKKVNISGIGGIGIGGLLPRTDATLLNNTRNDAFHLAGFGANILAGLNATFYRYFFIQTELKGGYINMPDIRTTMSVADKAKQQFLFGQLNILFGVNLNVRREKR